MFKELVKNYGWRELVSAEATLRSSINAHTKHGYGNIHIAAQWMDNYRHVQGRINQLGMPGPPPVVQLPNPQNSVK